MEEPLFVQPLAVANLDVHLEVKGASTNLSPWVLSHIKAFRKSVGTSLEGFKAEITGLVLALEAKKKSVVQGKNSRKKGPFSSAMIDFSDFISKQGLIDLPMEGGTFTWSNSKEVASCSKLDKFLLSSDWEEHFPNIRQRQLQRLLSDHFPILVEGQNFQRDSRPFRFENMWLKADGFVDRVRSWWVSYTFRGSCSFWIASKLKALKLDLKKWNEEEFRNVENRMHKLWKDLNDLDLIADCLPLTNEEILEKDWLHTKLEKLYAENEGQRPVLNEVEFSKISREDATWLDRLFEEEEAIFEKSLNATLLAFIPKKVDAVNRCGFSEQWSKWILFCISRVKFSILINGFTVGPRYHTPLMVSHLLFADNTLIFSDALPSQIGKLRDILSSFKAVSVCGELYDKAGQLLSSSKLAMRLHWDLRFYRKPQDEEMEQFDIFWNLIHSMTFTSEGHDKLYRKSTKNKGFERFSITKSQTKPDTSNGGLCLACKAY
uniref:Uncharacterized protein n=1 Tax=Quercus lobata TaxID=97700 RepID=A0A7N2MBQ8_QUELO